MKATCQGLLSGLSSSLSEFSVVTINAKPKNMVTINAKPKNTKDIYRSDKDGILSRVMARNSQFGCYCDWLGIVPDISSSGPKLNGGSQYATLNGQLIVDGSI